MDKDKIIIECLERGVERELIIKICKTRRKKTIVKLLQENMSQAMKLSTKSLMEIPFDTSKFSKIHKEHLFVLHREMYNKIENKH